MWTKAKISFDSLRNVSSIEMYNNRLLSCSSRVSSQIFYKHLNLMLPTPSASNGQYFSSSIGLIRRNKTMANAIISSSQILRGAKKKYWNQSAVITEKYYTTINLHDLKNDEKLLQGKLDHHNGIRVDLNDMVVTGGSRCFTNEQFDTMLSESLKIWRAKSVNSAWLRVPINMSHLISIAHHHGFEYHHAEGDNAMLCLWLDESNESRLPMFASHQIGVAGVVINEEKRDVLVVKDKNSKYSVWKFPGGQSDLGEDIEATAVREVFEETGIHSEFQSILAFRQQHNQRNAFGRSDIYILCRMKPLSFEIVPCSKEIEDAQWMNLGHLVRHNETSAFSRHMARLLLHGLDHGFQSVDVIPNWTKSVFKTDMKLFHRPLDFSPKDSDL